MHYRQCILTEQSAGISVAPLELQLQQGLHQGLYIFTCSGFLNYLVRNQMLKTKRLTGTRLCTPGPPLSPWRSFRGNAKEKRRDILLENRSLSLVSVQHLTKEVRAIQKHVNRSIKYFNL